MMNIIKEFKGSLLISAIGIIFAFIEGWHNPGNAFPLQAAMHALFLTIVLSVLEVSLSFDNAVVNAGVLKKMDPVWQHRFLTWGILIAVFGMRLVFPIVIVSAVTGFGPITVMDMALHRPDEYARHLSAEHHVIAAFGGMFLLMVFLHYFLDHEKEVHWLHVIEEKLSALGRLNAVQLAAAILILIGFASLHSGNPQDPHYLQHKISVLISGLAGLMVYVLVDSFAAYMEEREQEMAAKGIKQGGIALFIYLEVLDASFSFDGVIGAFAITNDVIIIMLGLGIGALFVRSLTIFLVKKGTLEQYCFLEHGAHYAIGALAGIMMLSTNNIHIPEVITGCIGVVLIGLSVWSSKKAQERLYLPNLNKEEKDEQAN